MIRALAEMVGRFPSMRDRVIAVIVLARLCANGFTSLWCFYAALASGAIALHLRFSQTRQERETVAV